MIVERQNLGILKDNEESYLSLLRAAIECIDEYSRLVISKAPREMIFRIVPSQAVYLDAIIKSVNSVNTMLNIRTNYSKSIKSSSVIIFKLSL